MSRIPTNPLPQAEQQALLAANYRLAYKAAMNWMRNKPPVLVVAMGGAEDVAAEAVWIMVRAMPFYSPRWALSTFVFACVWRGLNDLAKRQRQVLREARFSEFGWEGNAPELGLARDHDFGRLEREEDANRVLWHLARMSRLDQRLIVGRFWNGLSLKELGKQLGHGRARIQQLCTRAVARLADRLGKPEPLERYNATVAGAHAKCRQKRRVSA